MSLIILVKLLKNMKLFYSIVSLNSEKKNNKQKLQRLKKYHDVNQTEKSINILNKHEVTSTQLHEEHFHTKLE